VDETERKGSPVTFDEWASTRLEPLLRFAAVLCGNRALAEDVVQDVLLKAQSRWERIQQADRPDSYLRKMVVNEYLTWRRKWARQVPRPEITLTDTTPDHATGLADRDHLVSELAKLPRRQRTVLVLRYYGGNTDAEIAELMTCSPSTVRSYASRALATLRVELTPTPDPQPDHGATHAH
jgi:RNA polymerase sigma-70 factor (sigma-E family)